MSELEEQEVQSQSQEGKFFGVKTEINTSKPDLEVEIVDDTPEEDRRPKKTESTEPADDDTLDQEISDYSKRAGDRINKIKYEFHEERRAKEAIQRENQEAVNRLKTMMSENERLQAMVSQGGEALNKQALNNAQWAKHNAQSQFKSAYDEGDADKMAQAQELLAKATYAEQQSSGYAASLQQNVDQNLPKEQPVPEQIPRTMDADMKEWSNKNSWFMNNTNSDHQVMTAYAMFLDQNLKTKGVDPATKSKEYYSEIDKNMKNQFPEFFGVQSSTEESVEYAPKRQPANVVAPASRNSGKKPRSIRLTQSQVAIARKLGITPESYANQLIRES